MFEGLFAALAVMLGSIVASAVSAGSAKKQMKFQERMSSTAHQREAKDLLAAGYNPLYTAGGSGASSPVGAMYQPENPLRDLPQSLFKGAEVKMEKRLKAKQGKLIDQEVNTQKQVEKNNSAQALKNRKEAALAVANAETATALQGKINREKGLLEYQQHLNDIDRELYDIPVLGKGIRWFEKLVPIIGTAAAGKYIFSRGPKGKLRINPEVKRWQFQSNY